MGQGRILMVNDIQMDHLNAIENDKMYACGLANVHRDLFVLDKVWCFLNLLKKENIWSQEVFKCVLCQM